MKTQVAKNTPLMDFSSCVLSFKIKTAAETWQARVQRHEMWTVPALLFGGTERGLAVSGKICIV